MGSSQRLIIVSLFVGLCSTATGADSAFKQIADSLTTGGPMQLRWDAVIEDVENKDIDIESGREFYSWPKYRIEFDRRSKKDGKTIVKNLTIYDGTTTFNFDPQDKAAFITKTRQPTVGGASPLSQFFTIFLNPDRFSGLAAPNKKEKATDSPRMKIAWPNILEQDLSGGDKVLNADIVLTKEGLTAGYNAANGNKWTYDYVYDLRKFDAKITSTLNYKGETVVLQEVITITASPGAHVGADGLFPSAFKVEIAVNDPMRNMFCIKRSVYSVKVSREKEADPEHFEFDLSIAEKIFDVDSGKYVR